MRKEKKSGINVNFAADFAQLPPGETWLFAHMNAASVDTPKVQTSVFGKLLWLSIKTVAILNEVIWQTRSENKRFVNLFGPSSSSGLAFAPILPYMLLYRDHCLSTQPYKPIKFHTVPLHYFHQRRLLHCSTCPCPHP